MFNTPHNGAQTAKSRKIPSKAEKKKNVDNIEQQLPTCRACDHSSQAGSSTPSHSCCSKTLLHLKADNCCDKVDVTESQYTVDQGNYQVWKTTIIVMQCQFKPLQKMSNYYSK